MKPNPAISIFPVTFFTLLAKLPFSFSLLQIFLNRTLSNLQNHNRGVSDRLSEFYGKRLLIEFLDLPFDLVLNIHQSLTVQIVPHTTAQNCGAFATVRSEFYPLWQLFQGKADGDALFFSRDLSIQGNTELIVALRNALDGVQIDWVRDVVDPPKILSPLFKKAFHAGERVSEHFHEDLSRLQNTLLSPIHKQLDKLAQTEEQLTERVTILEKQNRRLLAFSKKREEIENE